MLRRREMTFVEGPGPRSLDARVGSSRRRQRRVGRTRAGGRWRRRRAQAQRRRLLLARRRLDVEVVVGPFVLWLGQEGHVLVVGRGARQAGQATRAGRPRARWSSTGRCLGADRWRESSSWARQESGDSIAVLLGPPGRLPRSAAPVGRGVMRCRRRRALLALDRRRGRSAARRRPTRASNRWPWVPAAVELADLGPPSRWTGGCRGGCMARPRRLAGKVVRGHRSCRPSERRHGLDEGVHPRGRRAGARSGSRRR
jgi:hypothetical protein